MLHLPLPVALSKPFYIPFCVLSNSWCMFLLCILIFFKPTFPVGEVLEGLLLFLLTSAPSSVDHCILQVWVVRSLLPDIYLSTLGFRMLETKC